MNKSSAGALLLAGSVAFVLAVAAVLASTVDAPAKLLLLALLAIVAGVAMAVVMAFTDRRGI